MNKRDKILIASGTIIIIVWLIVLAADVFLLWHGAV